MTKNLFPIVLLLSLVLYPSYQDDTPSKEIQPNYYEKLEIINDSSPKFYKITLSNLPDDTDISISTQSPDNTAPQIYISTTNPNPQDPNTSEEADTEPQGGIIWIPYSKLRDGTGINLGVICVREKCTADLTVEFSREFYASADGNINRFEKEIAETTSAVIRLYVPSTPNADRIIIHADAIPTQADVVPSLQMFINKGMKIPDTNYAEIIPRTGWFEGKTAVIYKGTELFETDIEYTISLKFAKGSYISFRARVMEPNAAIGAVLGSSVFLDVIQQGRTNTYTYTLDQLDANKDVIFDISPQKGSVDVEISCGDETSEHTWAYHINKKEEAIVLTPEEYSACATNPFAIAVKSNEASVYNIRVGTREAKNMFLLLNEPTIGRIDPMETIEYDLSMPLYALEKIQLKLNTTGKVNISIINCKFPSDCPGLVPEDNMQHSDIGGLVPNFHFDRQVIENEGQIITIDPHDGGCYPILVNFVFFNSEPIPVCGYHINITSEDSSPVDYTLTADPQSHDRLLLSIPSRTVVSEGEIQYYLLDVNQENVSSVTFQLTVFSGYAEMFVSRTQQFPNETTVEAQLQHEDFIVFQNTSNLTGRYYIAVKGNETSSFSLTATAYDVNGAKEENSVLLEESIPHKGVLLPKHEYPTQFFKINVNVSETWEGSLKISSVSLQGKILLVASADFALPDPMLSSWASQTGTLEINSTDEEFVRNGTYYIGVYVDWTDPRSYAIQDITFLLTYHIQHKESSSPDTSNKVPVILTSFFPFTDVIQPDQTMYFKVFILPEEQSITIFKQADAGDIDLYLSTSTHNVYPNADNYNYSTKDSHQNHITLNTTDFQEACKDKVEKKLCSVNFAVMTSSSQEVSFRLSVERGARGSAPIALEDGKQSVYNLPEANQAATFYFYPSPKRDSFIEVTCSHKEIEIYVNRRPVVIDSDKKSKDIPTPESNDFASAKGTDLETGFAHLLVPADSTADSTIVTVAIYFKDGYSATMYKDIAKIKTFNIVVSSHILEMYTGRPVLSHVARDTYQYYFVNVHKVKCNLLISLTALDDGDPDLVVSQGWLSRPTLEDHTFASISKQGTESIKITPLDIYPKPSMEGIWVIGVYGRSNTRFSLTVVYEELGLIILQQGIPVEMYLAADSKMYFKYMPSTGSDLDINIDQLSGDLTAYVKVLPGGEVIDDNLPSNDDKTWTINPDRESALKIRGNVCSNCVYLIGLEIKQSSKFIITVLEEQSILRIQNSILYQNTLPANSSKKYVFFAKNLEEVELNVDLKSGTLGVYVLNNPTVNRTNSVWSNYLTTNLPSQRLQLRKEDFASTDAVIWDGTTEVVSLKDVFFFYFENEQNMPAKYSFSLNSKEGTLALKVGTSQDFDFQPLQKKTFVYYSPHVNGQTNLELSYCTTTVKPESERDKDFVYSQVLEGFESEIRFWSQKVTAGAGEELAELKNDIFIDTVEEQRSGSGLMAVCLKQTIVIENQDTEGKYEFTLKNTLGSDTVLSLRVDTTEVDYKVLEKNTQYIEYIAPGSTKDFEVIMPNRGAWYFSVFTCQGKLKVIVGDTPEAIDAQQAGAHVYSGLEHPKQFEYKVPISEPGVKYVRVIGDSAESGMTGDQIEFMMVSSFFQDNQSYDYSPTVPRQQGLYSAGMGHEYNYHGADSELVVHFTPLNFTEVDEDDKVSFFFRLCPQEVVEQKENYCIQFHQMDQCTSQFQSATANNNETRLVQKFQKVKPGDYVVHLVGSVNHEGENILPFAYKTFEVELREPVSSQILDYVYIILIACGVLLFVVISYRAVRRASAAKKNTARSYDFVQEEAEDTIS